LHFHFVVRAQHRLDLAEPAELPDRLAEVVRERLTTEDSDAITRQWVWGDGTANSTSTSPSATQPASSWR
jgi:hypothetical protein